MRASAQKCGRFFRGSVDCSTRRMSASAERARRSKDLVPLGVGALFFWGVFSRFEKRSHPCVRQHDCGFLAGGGVSRPCCRGPTTQPHGRMKNPAPRSAIYVRRFPWLLSLGPCVFCCHRVRLQKTCVVVTYSRRDCHHDRLTMHDTEVSGHRPERVVLAARRHRTTQMLTTDGVQRGWTRWPVPDHQRRGRRNRGRDSGDAAELVASPPEKALVFFVAATENAAGHSTERQQRKCFSEDSYFETSPPREGRTCVFRKNKTRLLRPDVSPWTNLAHTSQAFRTFSFPWELQTRRIHSWCHGRVQPKTSHAPPPQSLPRYYALIPSAATSHAMVGQSPRVAEKSLEDTWTGVCALATQGLQHEAGGRQLGLSSQFVPHTFRRPGCRRQRRTRLLARCSRNQPSAARRRGRGHPRALEKKKHGACATSVLPTCFPLVWGILNDLPLASASEGTSISRAHFTVMARFVCS